MISVGEILKKEREKKQLIISDIAEKIRVREKFLLAVEQNDWNKFSSKVYITGLIKNYSAFLGLDSARTLALFRRDYERVEEVKFKKKVSSQYLTPETRRAVFLGVVFIFISFFLYFGYQLKLYFSPPKIMLISPKSNVILRDDKIKIMGKTDKDAAITILGDRVFQNRDGVFEYILPLKEGKNELIIEIVGANGRKTISKSEFLRK